LWVPIALVGTSAAFIVGFKNTQTYNRLWEARQIWGGIVNLSRSWGLMATGFVSNAPIQQRLVYRHIAWLTALRFQMREKRSWENQDKPANVEFGRRFVVPEWQSSLEDELRPLLSGDELRYVMSKKNRATHLISLQSRHLKELKETGALEVLSHIEMENMLVGLYDQQGRSERIKNFPYPRQFSTISLFFIRIFVFMVPFGLLQDFDELGEHWVWLSVPFSLIVMWIFYTMERIGESTENPFEGTANDVPISSIARTIEIDLREMLDENTLPPALPPVNSIQM
jgi:ion channel-forming bestrophin family protein